MEEMEKIIPTFSSLFNEVITNSGLSLMTWESEYSYNSMKKANVENSSKVSKSHFLTEYKKIKKTKNGFKNN
jgi:hypothetical protein